MKKLSSTFKNMVLSLGIICFSMALVLGAVYQATLEPIRQTEIKTKTEALSKVLPEFDNNPLEEEKNVALEGEPDSLITYRATEGGNVVGYAIETYSKNGFGGQISLMVGFLPDGTIKDFTVLSHGETPGLGAKMNDWFHQPNRSEGTIRNFCGISMPNEHPLSVTKDGGKVDAITASTISSRAFIDAVERAYRAFAVISGDTPVEATSSATSVANEETSPSESLAEDDSVAMKSTVDSKTTATEEDTNNNKPQAENASQKDVPNKRNK